MCDEDHDTEGCRDNDEVFDKAFAKPPAAVRREYAWRGEPGSAADRGEPVYNREGYFR